MYDDQYDDQGEWARYNWYQQNAPPNPAESVNWTPGLTADLADSESNFLPPQDPGVTPPGATGGGGGKTPQQIEAEGRAYDQAHGLVGGYMNGTTWVNGSPTTSKGGGSDPGGFGGYQPNGDIYGAYRNPMSAPMSQYAYTPTEAPRFNAPQWAAPTGEQITNEPGYDFRLREGAKALERSAASKGIVRTGGTMKGLVDYNQNFASHEYSNVFNRALEGFDRNYRGALDEYRPQFDEWTTKSNMGQREAENNWNREWDRYKFETDDQFKRTDAFQKFMQWQAEHGET